MAINLPGIDDIFDLLFPEEQPTVAVQRRFLDETTEKPYVIDMSITDAGDLPDRGLFKFQIVDPSDRSSDEFESVTTPEEFDIHSTKRKKERLKNNQFYRRTQVVLRFDSLTEAQQQVEQINDAVNDTAKDYNILVHQFKSSGTGETLSFPKATTESLDVKKERYRTLGTDLESDLREKQQAQTQRDNVDEFLDLAIEVDNSLTTLSDTIAEAIPATGDATGILESIRTAFNNIQNVATQVRSTYDTNIRLRFVTAATAGDLLSNTSDDLDYQNDAIFPASSYQIGGSGPITMFQGYFYMEEDMDSLNSVKEDLIDLRPDLTSLQQALSDITSVRNVFNSKVVSKVSELRTQLQDRVDSLDQQITQLNKSITQKENQRETLLAEIQRVDPSYEPQLPPSFTLSDVN